MHISHSHVLLSQLGLCQVFTFNKIVHWSHSSRVSLTLSPDSSWVPTNPESRLVLTVRRLFVPAPLQSFRVPPRRRPCPHWTPAFRRLVFSVGDVASRGRRVSSRRKRVRAIPHPPFRLSIPTFLQSPLPRAPSETATRLTSFFPPDQFEATSPAEPTSACFRRVCDRSNPAAAESAQLLEREALHRRTSPTARARSFIEQTRGRRNELICAALFISPRCATRRDIDPTHDSEYASVAP